MHYDQETNILSIEIGKGKITHTSEFGNFIVHMTAAKKPVLVEILDASKFIGQFENINNLKEIKNILPVN